jgi:seryl-tRNA synthetase
VEFVHTLNGTAIPLARALVVMLENFAVEGGKFKVPEVLRPYLGGKEEL